MTEEIKTEISTDCSYYKDVVKNEILIDGVNVARCCCYENGKCLWTKRYYESGVVPDCEKIKDCYYKQLKRLEFELKVTKADYEASEQENKELREENSLLAYNLHIKENEAAHYLKEVNRHRSALEEIKEIVSDEIDKTDSDDELMQIYSTIYNKINEVLDVSF